MTGTLKISLRAARVNAGLTITEAAEKLNVNRSTIINWEKNRTYPTVEQMARLSTLYGISSDYIFFSRKYT